MPPILNARTIIPRGFGGIRTTYSIVNKRISEIIPRGFGGIRTTSSIRRSNSYKIIPRGFGGIRTTAEQLALQQ